MAVGERCASQSGAAVTGAAAHAAPVSGAGRKLWSDFEEDEELDPLPASWEKDLAGAREGALSC